MRRQFDLSSANRWNLGSSLIALILSLLTAGLAVRWLPREDAGLVLVLNSFLLVAETVGGFGIGEASLRQLSKLYDLRDDDRAERVYSTALVAVAIMFGTILCLMVVFGGQFLYLLGYPSNGNGETYVNLIFVGLLCHQLKNQMLIALPATHQYRIYSLYASIGALVSAVGMYLVLAYSKSMLALGMFKASIECLLALGALFLPASVRIFRIRLVFDRKIFTEFLRFGRSIFATRLLASMTNGLDRIILSAGYGLAAVTPYAISRRLFEAIHRLLAGQSAYLFPYMSSLRAPEARRFLAKIRWEYASISLLLYLGLASAGPVLLVVIAGEAFAKEAVPFIHLFVIIGFLQSFEIVLFPYAMAIGRPNFCFVSKLVAAGITFSTMYVLSRTQLSIVVAGLGQLGIGASPFLLSYLIYARSFKRFIRTHMLPPTLVLIASTLCALWLDQHFPLPTAWLIKLALCTAFLLAHAYVEIFVRKSRRARFWYDELLRVLHRSG